MKNILPGEDHCAKLTPWQLESFRKEYFTLNLILIDTFPWKTI
jgi:hypothetical protein